MKRLGLLAALVSLWGCPGDDGTAEGTTTTTTMTTTGPEATSTGPSGSSSGEAATTSGGMADSSSGGAMGSSSSGAPVCETPVVGEWNSCLDEQGEIDNTQCNWVIDPEATTSLTCFSGPPPEGGNVCIMRDCEDVCDCFDPPATGTAEVICEEILGGGARGCALDCSSGQTCPDGMMCWSGLCWWPDP